MRMYPYGIKKTIVAFNESIAPVGLDVASMHKSNNKKIIVYILCLLAYAGTMFAASWHHHDDGKIFDNCQLCRFNDYNNTSQTLYTFIFVVPVTHEIVAAVSFTDIIPERILTPSARTHAPPCIS